MQLPIKTIDEAEERIWRIEEVVNALGNGAASGDWALKQFDRVKARIADLEAAVNGLNLRVKELERKA